MPDRNGSPSVESRLGRVEQAVVSLTDSIDGIQRDVGKLVDKIQATSRTQWGPLGTWIGALLLMVGAGWTIITRDIDRTDVVLQREIRLLTGPLEERVKVNKESIDSMREWVNGMVPTRWTKEDAVREHNEINARLLELERRK